MTEPGSKEALLAEFKDAFTLGDVDYDGWIPNKDFSRIMKLLGMSPTEAEIHEYLAIMDSEKLGAFSINNFVNTMSDIIKDDYSDEYLRQAFDIIDTDSNGMISTSDLRRIISNLGENFTDEEVEDMIKEADLDGDGQVNYDEFSYMMSGGK